MHLGRIAQVGRGELLPVEALAVPHRNAVAPPELPADAPVLDVLEPVQVDLRPALGIETGCGRRGPPPWPPRPRDSAATTARSGAARSARRPAPNSRHCSRRAPPHEGAGGPEQFRRLLAAGEPVQPGQLRAGQLVERRRRRWSTSIDRQPVALADLEVGLVVGRGDLERAGAELPVHRRVGDDRESARG